METWDMIEAERAEVADFFESLNDEQWNTDTLCGGWKVKHVAAHLTEASTLGAGAAIVLIAKNGFSFNKAMLNSALQTADTHTQAQQVAEFRAQLKNHKTPPGAKPVVMLNDLIVHHQDCRRPLGMPRAIAEDRLRTVLDHTVKTQPIIGSKKRVAGLTLVATDLDWTHGEGPEVRGTGEALLLVATGRRAVLGELAGDGVATLQSR